MLARWYHIMLGFLFIVFGIAGLVAASALPGSQGGLVAISVIWLIIAAVALWVGYRVDNVRTQRWLAGIIGGALFIWGVVQLFASVSATTAGSLATIASIGGFLVFLGAIGLAAASVPAVWAERTTTQAT